MKQTILSLLLILTFPWLSFSYPPGNRSCLWGWDNFPMGFGGIFMWFLISILLVAGIYLAVKYLKNNSLPFSTNDNPLEILKRRYAKGEISKEEFDSMKQDISI